MKKYIFLISMIVLMNSCGNKDNTSSHTLAQESKQAVATVSIPTFSDSAVNKGVQLYQEYITAYITAINAKDTASLRKLELESQSLIDQSASWESKIKPDELAKYQAYSKALLGKVAEAVEKNKKK